MTYCRGKKNASISKNKHFIDEKKPNHLQKEYSTSKIGVRLTMDTKRNPGSLGLPPEQKPASLLSLLKENGVISPLPFRYTLSLPKQVASLFSFLTPFLPSFSPLSSPKLKPTPTTSVSWFLIQLRESLFWS